MGADGQFMGDIRYMAFDSLKGYVLGTDQGEMYLRFLDHGIVQVSFVPKGSKGVTPSEIIVPTPTPEEVIVIDTEKGYVFSYDEVYELWVGKSPLKLSMNRLDKKIMSDEEGFFIDKKDQIVGTRISLLPDEHIYGTGSRALPLDRRGMRFNLFHSAVYGYTSGEPTLNISLPIYHSSKQYAIYFDNDRRGYFDLGKSDPNVLEYGTMDLRGLNYYIIPGDEPIDIAKGYTYLTGHQPMPPSWALGYIQSRYGYKTQDEAERMVDTLLQADFPLDAIVLDLFWFGDKEQMGQLDWEKSQMARSRRHDEVFSRERRSDHCHYRTLFYSRKSPLSVSRQHGLFHSQCE